MEHTPLSPATISFLRFSDSVAHPSLANIGEAKSKIVELLSELHSDLLANLPDPQSSLP